jgi:outer membrane protein W
MRNVAAVAVAVLASSGLAFGEDRGATRISAFVSDIAYTESQTTGRNFSAGFGLALNHWWSPRFSTELSVASERRFTQTFSGTGPVISERRRTVPIDLSAQYHFLNESRWKPYIGVGQHVLTSRGFGSNTRLSLQVNGGVMVELTPRFGLRFDAKQLLSDANPSYDPGHKTSLGVSWKF